MHDRYEWVKHKFAASNRVDNISTLKYQKRWGTKAIDLSQHYILLAGYNNQAAFTYFIIRIRGNISGKPLVGPHFVELYDNDNFCDSIWVRSLTCLKQKYCNLVDRLSFERCAYLIQENDHELVRLKGIRSLLMSPILRTLDGATVFENEKKNITKKLLMLMVQENKNDQLKEISPRIQNQLYDSLSTLCNGFMRYQNTGVADSDILKKFEEEVKHTTESVVECIRKKNEPEEPIVWVIHSPVTFQPMEEEVEPVNCYISSPLVFEFTSYDSESDN